MPRWTKKRNLLPGCNYRPWLEEEITSPRYGNETQGARGRVRVTIGYKHRFANSAGWQWRYRLMVSYALERKLKGPKLGPSSDRVTGKRGRLQADDYAEHVDHKNGIINDDRLDNFRLLSASIHGQLHARATTDAGWRTKDGKFIEQTPKREYDLHRWGPIISNREIIDFVPVGYRLVTPPENLSPQASNQAASTKMTTGHLPASAA